MAAAITLGCGALIAALWTGTPPLAAFRVPDMGRRIPSTVREGIPRAFLTEDSLELQGQQLVAPSRGTIVLLHGLGEHDSAYVTWAGALSAASGMNVVAFTLRGNGYGTAPTGDVPQVDAYLRDVAGLVRELKRRTPSGPVLLVGIRQGAGLAARYAGDGRAPSRPAVQGVVVVHPVTSLDDLRTEPIGHGGRVEWHTRRLRVLQWLGRASISLFDGLPVVYQQVPSANGLAVRRYSYRALRALFVEPPWPALQRAGLPTLVLSASRPESASYRLSDRSEWARVVAADRGPSTAATAALTNWTAQFSGDAALPPPVLPYRPLPILPPTP